MTMTRTMTACAAVGLALAASAPLGAQKAARRAAARESGMPFTVEVRHVRAGGQFGNREVTVLLRVRNVSQRTLTLAYDPASRIITDDRGNRSGTGEPMYGMGAATPPTFDDTFTLTPGSSADALQRFSYNVPQGKLFGTAFAIQMAVREFQRLPGDQWQDRGSHVITFNSLTEGARVPANAATTADACAGRTDCSASGDLMAELTRVTNSMSGTVPVTRIGVRFHNASGAPVTLCLMQYAQFGMDDRGLPYLANAVQAIPVCEREPGNVTFTVAPGGSRDASLEYSYRGARGAIRGTSASLNFAVRQIELVPGDQVKMLRVIPLVFRDVAVTGERAVAGVGPSPAGTPAAPGAPGQSEACANVPNCYAAGPFSAQLTSVVPSQIANTRYLRLGVRIRNLGADRLILCFESGSGVVDDDRQNRYGLTASEASTVKGIGICYGQTANTQFTLAPGATRDASFEFRTGIYAGTVLGNTFAVNFALNKLDVLPGEQIQQSGQYVVNFEGVTASGGPAAAGAKAAGLLDLLRQRMKKP